MRMFIYHVYILLAIFIGRGSAELRPLAVRLPLEGTEAAPGAPWPKPQEWQENDALKTLDPETLSITSDVTGCDVIDGAISRYRAIITLDANAVAHPAHPQMTDLIISVEDKACGAEDYPHYGMDESYTLSVDSQIQISSKGIWGALRGLETFSQLVHLSDAKEYQINATSISDAPRFAYRGLMVDTARHFEPMEVIMDILDAMTWDKFNAFHWHVVDDQSFPYPSRTFPELQEKGAYSEYHTYSRDDVTTILREARLRGIFVIPEFDTPGHTWSWGLSHPELITPCWGEGLEGGPGVPDYPNYGPREIMNPIEEGTYTFLDTFYTEVVEDFPERYVHLGMDETYYSCWESSPNISAWMAVMNFTTYSQVEQYFCERLIQIVENKGSDYIIWQDPINNNVTVSPNTLVQVWKGDEINQTWQYHLDLVISRGYNALLSSPWYLNYISYGDDWRNYYMVEPHNFTEDESKWSQVKGGEACIWAEYVDGSNIVSRLWPRASAIAERLWSHKDENDVESAKFRLDQHRCRYVRRGIPAAPILNGYCGDYEWTGRHPGEETPIQLAPRAGGSTLVVMVLLLGWVVAV